MTYDGLTLFGNGPGSYWAMYFQTPTTVTGIGHVHNDFLQLAFEFGIGAIPLFALYAAVLTRSSAREWPIFLAFASMALFSFPLYAPITAALGLACAGRIARDWGLAWDLRGLRRSHLIQRLAAQ